MAAPTLLSKLYQSGSFFMFKSCNFPMRAIFVFFDVYSDNCYRFFFAFSVYYLIGSVLEVTNWGILEFISNPPTRKTKVSPYICFLFFKLFSKIEPTFNISVRINGSVRRVVDCGQNKRQTLYT